MARNNLPVHPRERLGTVPPQILGPDSKLDLQHGRFFITNQEFELRIDAICFQFWKIQAFSNFGCDNHNRIKERHFVCGNLFRCFEFLSLFLTTEFVDPKGMFHKICRQDPFEFLIMFDLCRE